MDVREIEGIIPHRYPFLLVEGISELIPGSWAVGHKRVSAGEFFLQDGPGGKQVLPRALVLEAMAQVGAVAFLSHPLYRGKSTLLAGINEAAFMRDVAAGDEIRLEAEVTKIKGNIGKRKCRALVRDVLVAKADILFALI
ncbi:MAG: 3-hydroxyacyl-[acyl-carrier-protein] dehydratase FabZ [Firmicutes bacterium]|nr:3-hydroxyacyl-[acyl-carrier-protein] dehydratase FabZ [Bacillota bacterium]